MKTKNVIQLSFLLLAGMIFIFSVGCKEGPAGATGPAGAAGAAGAQGVKGDPGTNGSGMVTAADSTAYLAADEYNGGQLYDAFTKVLTVTDTTILNNRNFFRCKQCHGWDLIGTKGAYISRASSATRPNVAPNNLRAFAGASNIKEVFNAVKHVGGRTHKTGKVGGVSALNDIMPDYSSILSDSDVWDITKFLMEGAFNPDDIYDLVTTGIYPTGSYVQKNIGADGVAATGATYYAATCASVSCHGADGTGIAIEAQYYLGDFFRSKAYEAQHKLKFGQPGTAMNAFTSATLQDVLDVFAAGQDTTAFPSF